MGLEKMIDAAGVRAAVKHTRETNQKLTTEIVTIR
jgi:hypothetical protein